MASYVDFQELKARVTIQQVLDMLGVKNLKPHGETLRGHCPCCQEGNDSEEHLLLLRREERR